MKSEPDILEFDDHRAYFEAVLTERRTRSSGLSLRQLSRKAGFGSPSSLSLVINGKRPMTLKAAEKLATALKLRGRRRQYLLILARFNLSKNLAEQNAYRQKLMELKSSVDESVAEVKTFRFLSQWYYAALYVLVGSKTFSDDFDALAKRLGRGITSKQVAEALQDLIDVGLVKKSKSRYSQAHPAISTPDDLKKSAMFLYHQKMAELAKEALELPLDEREFNGLTISIRPDRVAEVKTRVRKFRQDLNEYLSQYDDDGEVFQLNLQLFPLTQTKKDDAS